MKYLEKYSLLISIILILVGLAALFFFPAISQLLIWIVIIFGTGMAVILTAHRHYLNYLQEHHSRVKLAQNASLDVLGILLAIVGSIWLAGIVAAQVTPAVINTVEPIRPGMGYLAGIIAGLLSALCIGLGVGLLVRWVWGKMMARLS